MLQDIRKSTRGTTAKVVVGLIVVSFSIFGIESILLGGGGGGIAEVNGEQIAPEEVQQLVYTQKRRLISMMGDDLDPALIDDQRLSAQALESIIGRKLQMQSAADLKMGISEQQIGAVIGAMEQFQVDGKFSPELYKNMISSAGYTPMAFKRGLAEDMLLTQLSNGLVRTDFTTSAELELNATFTEESRDIRYLTIPQDKFSVNLTVEDDSIEQYYNANQLAFRTAESVELDYIELSPELFVQPAEDTDLQEVYELEKENYQYQTESGVSHILFERGPDESEDALQGRIQGAQEQLAAGAEFAELAKTVSDDIGSANVGGDLGFTRGDTFPEEMEAAILALEPGAVSLPVVTDAGVHLIKLTERRDGKMPPFEEMRAELAERVQSEAARRELTRVVELLRDLAFNAEDLSGPAREIDLEVQTISGIARNHAEGLFANASLLAAAFSQEVLEQGHNSDVIELANNRFVALRVREHKLPKPKPLAAVRAQIVASITEESSRAAVVDAAEQALVALNAGTGVESLANANGYDWQVELSATRANSMVPSPVLQRAFELSGPAAGQSVFDYVMTPAGDIQVFELASVTPGSVAALNPAQKKQLSQQITAEHARMANIEFQRGLRDRADITVL